MIVEIFDVEHGGCTLLTADSGARMLIDCGHNSSSNWRPSTYLPHIRNICEIDLFVVSNYDEDHVSDLPNLLRSQVNIRSLSRNKSVSPDSLRALKRAGGVGDGIRSTLNMMESYTAPADPVDWGSMTRRVFCNAYPSDFTDTNNLSVVQFLYCQGLHIVFAGDMERAGWLRLLDSGNFRSELAEVNVFVASHHGRESGCCEELFQGTGCQPDLFIMSDKATEYDTQRTIPWYRQRANGIMFGNGERRVLTTRRDGKITIEARPSGYQVRLQS
jgi:beta-lactamase superfamily II metal-dependent hydrolase